MVLDLFRPGFPNSLVGWRFVKAFNQTNDEQTAIVRGKRQGFVQDSGNLWRHLVP